MKSKFIFTEKLASFLISAIGSAFFAFAYFEYYAALVWIILTVCLIIIIRGLFKGLNWLTYKLVKLCISPLIAWVLIVVFYYLILKYKMYTTPQAFIYLLIATMSIITITFALIIDKFKFKHKVLVTIYVALLTVIAYIQFGPGFMKNPTYDKVLQSPQSSLSLEEPATFYYDEIDFEGHTVDLSYFLDQSDMKLELRKQILGYDIDEIPIKGQMFLPQSQSKVPLVVMIHGNHKMVTPSFEGYAYLGEYLAQRGIAFVSLDHRALNGYGTTDFDDENPARAILLLESIKELQNQYPQLDKKDITLLGHSRGGEAIVIASFFNDLQHYPNQPDMVFDYHFDIKNLFAIAPTYQQYSISSYPSDVNYVTIHGAHDQDVRTFRGQYAYQRIALKEENFKSNIYVANANHGQFNSTWGQYDTNLPKAFNTNIANLISENDQQQFIKVITTLLVRDNAISYEFFSDIHQFSLQLPKTWITQQSAFFDTFMLEDFEKNKETSFDGEVVKLLTREKQQTRNNSVLQLDVNQADSITYQLDQAVASIQIDMAGCNYNQPIKLLLEDGQGNRQIETIDISNTCYPVALSKWEIILGLEENSIMLETFNFDVKLENIATATLQFSEKGQVYLDNLGVKYHENP